MRLVLLKLRLMVPAPLNRILDVLFARAELKMLRVHALRVVAFVPDIRLAGMDASVEEVGQPMSRPILAPI
jgi:hypothetical protein